MVERTAMGNLLTLIIKELDFSVDQGRVVATLNIIKY
jgi:hypothetical protein